MLTLLRATYLFGVVVIACLIAERYGQSTIKIIKWYLGKKAHIEDERLVKIEHDLFIIHLYIWISAFGQLLKFIIS